MDGNNFYPLVPRPQQQGPLVLTGSAVVVLPDAADEEPDLLALLWRRFRQLAFLLCLALVALRRLRQQLVELRLQANYWRAQHQRAVQREAKANEQIQLLQGQIRELERRLYGRKCETSSAKNPQPPGTPPPQTQRSRGQQPGSKGHGRRRHEHLPTTHETCVLPDAATCCAACGEPLEAIPGTADGDILEIEVRAHRRRYHRQRYRRH